MQEILDKCVEKVMTQGKTKSQAFEICRSSLKLNSEQNVEEALKEKRLDEDGDIIIAENIKFNINAGISVVE